MAFSTPIFSRPTRNRDIVLSVLGIVALFILLGLMQGTAGAKLQQVSALFAIWAIASVSLNLVNGTIGILSLGHHGFMLVGGYTTALLILPEAMKETLQASGRSVMTDFTMGLSLNRWFAALGLHALTTPETLWVRFILALIIGGLVAAVFGFVVASPSLRLRGDYLAVVTLAFGEIARTLASTSLLSPYTNGSLGFTGLPTEFGTSLFWTFGILVITVFIMVKLKFSSYGRAFEGIREDEIAAAAMGVRLWKNKVYAFVLSAFFAGVAGGLYVSWLGSARLDSFAFALTFNFLVAVYVGGMGSYTGVLIGTALVVFVKQYGDPLEQPYPAYVALIALGVVVLFIALSALWLRFKRRHRPLLVGPLWAGFAAGGLLVLLGLFNSSLQLVSGTFQAYGMKSILLSAVLLFIMIVRPLGIMGSAEFSWAGLIHTLSGKRGDLRDEDRAQDAWLQSGEEGSLNDEEGR